MQITIKNKQNIFEMRDYTGLNVITMMLEISSKDKFYNVFINCSSSRIWSIA